MKQVTVLWLRKLIAAVVTGVSSSVLASLGTAAADAVGLNVPPLDAKQLGIIALTGGLVGLLAYLKQSPIPPDDDYSQPTNTTLPPLNKLPLLLALAMVALAGCKTPEQGAYRTIGTISVSVDAAMNGWGDYVRAGKATDTEQASVRAGYEKYQTTMRATKLVVASYQAQPDGAKRLDTALAAIEASGAEIITLIQQFTQAKL